jgi:hypothetical protein
MPWVMPGSLKPFASTSSASARAVPDEPIACSQPVFLYSLEMIRREESAAMAHAADIQAFHLDRRVVRADDEFGRTAADIDYEALTWTRRHRMCCARINQTSLFAPGNHFDREAQCSLRLAQELAGVLGNAQGVSGDRAHVIGVEIAQPLAEAFKRVPAAHLRGAIEHLVARQACGESH